MGTIVLALVVLLAALIAFALGLTWKGLLHWAGELLLIIGIALAAVGISDVKASGPGVPGSGDASSRPPAPPGPHRLLRVGVSNRPWANGLACQVAVPAPRGKVCLRWALLVQRQ